MTYTYKCECGNVFDIMCSLKERKKVKKCSCGKMAKRLFSPTPTHFKCRGFPSNDFRKRDRGKYVVDNKVEDLFDDHNYGKKYGIR